MNVIDTIKKYLNEYTKKRQEFESDDRIVKLMAEVEDKDLSYEETEKLEKKSTELYYEFFKSFTENISEEEIYNILLNLNEEELRNNNLSILSGYFKTNLSYMLTLFTEKITNSEYINNLLQNIKLFKIIDFQCKKILISKCRNEEILLNLVDELLTERSIYVDIVFPIMESQNVTNSFKLKLLKKFNNKPIMLKEIVKCNTFSIEEMKSIILIPDNYNKLNSQSFSSILGKICTSYDEFIEYINKEEFKDKIDFGYFLSELKMPIEEIKRIIFSEEIEEKLDDNDITILIEKKELPIELRKEILFHPPFFNKIKDKSNHIVDIVKMAYDGHIFLNLIINSEEFLNVFENDPTILNDILDINNSRKKLSPDKLFEFINNPKILNNINNYILRDIIHKQDFSLEQLDYLTLNKELFARLIQFSFDELLEEEAINEKYQIFLKLKEKNPYVAKTMNFYLLSDKLLKLDFNLIEKLSKYYKLANKIFGCSDKIDEIIKLCNVANNLKYSDELDLNNILTRILLITDEYNYINDQQTHIGIIRKQSNIDFSTLTPDQYRIILEIGLRDNSIYHRNIDDFHVGYDGFIKADIDVSLNIIPEIKTIDDLNNYYENRVQLCNIVFQQAIIERNLDKAKNAFLNKYLNINIEEAKLIAKMYSTSIDKIKIDESNIKQKEYLDLIGKIINTTKLEQIQEIFNNLELRILPYEETIHLDFSLKQVFSKQVSDSVYKISDKDIVEKEFKIKIGDNDEEIIKKVKVHELDEDFILLIHSTDAYGSLELINDNYYDSWNYSSRKSNHGICCSLISNSNMGMAEVNDVLFGFDGWDAKAITKMAPYDLYTSNDEYEIIEGRQTLFMTAQDIIDNTRHGHNEFSLERLELRPDKINYQAPNIQPSYVIIYSDMSDEIKQKAIKCSEQMNIPIVYLDKEKIVKKEMQRIDLMIEELNLSNNISERISIMQNILLKHENNRSGLKHTNPEWLEEYFPTEKINNIIISIIQEMQLKYTNNGNIKEYYNNAIKLIKVLKDESRKFEVTMESVGRANYIDIPVYEYISNIIKYIEPTLGLSNELKIFDVQNIELRNRPDTNFQQTLSQIVTPEFTAEINDLKEKNLYPFAGRNHNINHIERVMIYSSMIGQKELLNEDGTIDTHLFDLLIQCAKYHDCGRVNDVEDTSHGKASAKLMIKSLTGLYSEEDIILMKVAIECHVADDMNFKLIFEQNNLTKEQMEKATKLANCLKDADALDRVRFKNPSAYLNERYLRTKTSKEIIPFATELFQKYEQIDLEKFKIICQKIETDTIQLL